MNCHEKPLTFIDIDEAAALGRRKAQDRGQEIESRVAKGIEDIAGIACSLL